MAKILLINSPIRTFAPPNNPPLGVMYLSGVLKQAVHCVEVCDLNANRWMIDDREYWLRKHFGDWDYIGLSGLIVTYAQQRWILDFILANYESYGRPLLMTGGGLASSAPEFTKRHMPELDIIVRGEGEQTVLRLVDGITNYHEIGGICWKYRTYDAWFDNIDQSLIEDLDTIPYPDWDAVPMEEVYLGNPIWGKNAGNSSGIQFEAKRSANMVVSRGCPHRCTFCMHYVFGKKYRMRSVDNVMGEIIELKRRYDIDFVGMVDDNTCANSIWLTELCYALIKADLGIKWGCSATIQALDADLCKLMAEAGCLWVGFGIESASVPIREAMHKIGTPERAAQAVKGVRDAGMWANTTYVLGFPGETIETARETANWMRDNDCINSVFYATPYPGTELYTMSLPKIVEKWGSEDEYIKALADATDLRVNLTNMSDKRLMGIRECMVNGETF